MKEKRKLRKYTNTRRMTLPGTYVAGFLQTFDQRSVLFSELNGAFVETVDDLGGTASLSHLSLGLVERYIFVEFMVRNLERRMLQDEAMARKLFRRWRTASGILLSLAKTLGLERRVKESQHNLTTYIRRKQA
jgi:hypothetical protein